MAPIRVGVFGAGYWGTKLCTEYAAIEKTTGEAELAWIADASDAALAKVKERAGTDARVTNDYRRALRDGVDAVHIALPNPVHYQVAREALEARKHVLVEKPMSTNSTDAFRLVRLAKEKCLVLQVGHIFWYNNAIRMVKRIINTGVIGRVYYAKLEWAVKMVPPPGRDIVFDLAPHPISVLNDVLGEWPSGVSALGESYVRGEKNAEEMALVNMEFNGSKFANVYLSWIQHGGRERTVMVVGELGTVVCDALNQTVTLHTETGPFQVPRDKFPKSRSAPHGGSLEPGNSSEPNNTIRDMQYHFIDSIRSDEPQLKNAIAGAKTVEVLEKITEVMRCRQPATARSPPAVAAGSA